MEESEFQAERPPDEPRRPKPKVSYSADRDVDVRASSSVETFIPYKNPQGLLAYYLGVFSFIPCAGLVLGPAALILGILGVRYCKKHPTAGGFGHAVSGIVMGTLTTLANVGAIVAMIVSIALAAKH